MPKRSRTQTVLKKPTKKPTRLVTKAHRQERDENQAAFDLVRKIVESGEADGKNPLAVALGRRGGLKGGKAKAEKLSKAARSEPARIAANARWAKKV